MSWAAVIASAVQHTKAEELDRPEPACAMQQSLGLVIFSKRIPAVMP